METLLEFLKGRRSVRLFSDVEVSDEQLQQLFEAMRWAPSAGNAQPWRVTVVRSLAQRERLVAAALGQSALRQAPVVLVVAADLAEAERAYGSRGRELYALQDTAAAVQNLLLAAHATGLGACWMGAFRERSVAEIVGLPPTERPVALVPVGVPAEKPQAPSRRAWSEWVRWG